MQNFILVCRVLNFSKRRARKKVRRIPPAATNTHSVLLKAKGLRREKTKTQCWFHRCLLPWDGQNGTIYVHCTLYRYTAPTPHTCVKYTTKCRAFTISLFRIVHWECATGTLVHALCHFCQTNERHNSQIFIFSFVSIVRKSVTENQHNFMTPWAFITNINVRKSHRRTVSASGTKNKNTEANSSLLMSFSWDKNKHMQWKNTLYIYLDFLHLARAIHVCSYAHNMGTRTIAHSGVSVCVLYGKFVVFFRPRAHK